MTSRATPTPSHLPAPIRRLGRAFTLIEILVVLTIISILIAFTIPNIEPALKGSKLKQAGDDLEGALATARQVAVTTNIPVEFRFYNYADESQPGTERHFRSFQAVQLFYDPSNINAEPEVTPVTEVIPFPGTFIISDNEEYSTLCSNEYLERDKTVDVPRADDAEYYSFFFMPDGSTNLDTLNEQNWTVTIMADQYAASSQLPPEFVTLEVDAFNGQVRKFQF